MLRKLFKAGNSVVVSLPKDVIDYLHIDEGSEVSLVLDRENNQIVIAPVQPMAIEGVDQEFSRQVSEFIERYRTALEELAK